MADLTSSTSAAPVEDLSCPLCDYDLRGLTICRCPECGYTSTWDQLLDPRSHRHPYLFEHHPGRNLWSASRTFLGGLRPVRFWSSLFPCQPSRRQHLVVYGLVCNLLYVAVLATVLGSVLVIEVERTRAEGRRAFDRLAPQWKARYVQIYGSMEAARKAYSGPELLPSVGRALTARDAPFVYLMGMVVPAAWPWLTFLSLLVYKKSMRQSRVKSVHLLRVSIYSFDAIFCAALLFPVMLLFETSFLRASQSRFQPPFSFNGMGVVGGLLPLCAAVTLFCAVRLWIACRKYLQFRFAAAAVIGSQSMVLLVASCIVFTTDLFFEHVPSSVYLTLHRWLHISALLGAD